MNLAMAKLHRERYCAALAASGLGGSVAVFPAGSERLRSRDTHFRFRPDSDFWYLTGFADRVVCLAFSPDGKLLATGGGAFMDPSTRALIKAHGLSVWLRAGIDLLMERVTKRPTRL